MPRNLGIPNKSPNDLLTAAEFNTLVAAAEDSVSTVVDLGLQNVNNTSDANKPISIATQAALNNKQNNLGYSPENPNNKVVDLLTPNHTTYPTTLAVSNAIFEAISDGEVVIVDADATTKGKIRLAGDLGGTADAPTVPGLAAKQDTLTVGTTSQYRRGDNSLATLSTDVVSEGTTNKYLTSTEKSKLSGISAGATVNDSDVNLKNRANHTGTQNADTIIDGTTNKVFTSTEKTKLGSIATGATVNSSDATLLARASHTGTQSADTIIDGTTNKVYTATEKTKLAAIPTGATANDTDANLKNRANHTGTQSADTVVDGTANKVFTTANQTKLSGIATAATANSTDAQLRDRSLHTGSQAQSTITNLTTDLAGKQATLVSGTNVKTIGGVSILGSTNIDVPIKIAGVIPESDLPLVDIMPALSSQFEEVAGKATLKQSVLDSASFDMFDYLINNSVQRAKYMCGTTSTELWGLTALVTSTNVSIAYTIGTWLQGLMRLGTESTAVAGTAGIVRYGIQSYALTHKFKWAHKFAIIDGVGTGNLVSNGIMFCGMTTSIAAHAFNVEPSTLTDIIAVAADSTDANLQVMHNDSTGVATKVDLGVNFPANSSNTHVITVKIFGNAVDEAVIQVESRDANDGALIETKSVTVIDNLPTSGATQRLAWQVYRGNFSNAAKVTLAHIEQTVATIGGI